MASMDLTGISASALTEYAANEAKFASGTAVRDKLSKVNDNTSDKELMEACKSFESYFLEQIFKEMYKSVDALKPDTGDNATNTLVEYFRNETLQDICANSVENQSNGFAQMLYENLKRNYDIPQAPSETGSETDK